MADFRLESRMASKYDALRKYLKSQNAKSVTLTLKQIDAILPSGQPLPKSAHIEGAWWGNETHPGTRHVQAKFGWLAAGRRATPDLMNDRVTFSK
jgi:hypothetical protein